LKNILAYIYLRESAIRKILQNTYFISLSDQKVVKVSSSNISKSVDCISITTFKDFFSAHVLMVSWFFSDLILQQADMVLHAQFMLF